MRGQHAELLFFRDDADLGNTNTVVDAKTRFRATTIETSSWSHVHSNPLCCMCLMVLLDVSAGPGFYPRFNTESLPLWSLSR